MLKSLHWLLIADNFQLLPINGTTLNRLDFVALGIALTVLLSYWQDQFLSGLLSHALLPHRLAFLSQNLPDLLPYSLNSGLNRHDVDIVILHSPKQNQYPLPPVLIRCNFPSR